MSGVVMTFYSGLTMQLSTDDVHADDTLANAQSLFIRWSTKYRHVDWQSWQELSNVGHDSALICST